MLLSVAVLLGFIAGIMVSLPFFKTGQIVIGITMICLYSIGVIIVSFFLYILIDIRDKIAQSNELLKEKSINEKEHKC